LAEICIDGKAAEDIYSQAIGCMPKGAAAVAGMIAGRERRVPLERRELFYETVKAMRRIGIEKGDGYLKQAVDCYLRRHFNMPACNFRVKDSKNKIIVRFKSGAVPEALLKDMNMAEAKGIDGLCADTKPLDAYLKIAVEGFLEKRLEMENAGTAFDVKAENGKITIMFDAAVPQALLTAGKPSAVAESRGKAAAKVPGKEPAAKAVAKKRAAKPKAAAVKRTTKKETEQIPECGYLEKNV